MSLIGRPKRISRETLEEAATELFLERGYPSVSVDDIAARAGVSRATFFNYFGAKVDVLFVEIDAALEHLEALLGTEVSLREAIAEVARDADTRDVPLIARQSEVMGATDDVAQAVPTRMWRLRALVATRISEPVWQWAIAGAIAHASYTFARGAGQSLEGLIKQQLDTLGQLPPSVRAIVG